MAQARPDNAGVHVPPPLIYFAAFAGGALLRRTVPLPIGGGLARVILAWALAAASVGLAASGVISFWRRHTSVVPIQPATTLVVAGPYRFTRNPMYVGLALLTAATGLWLNTWWVFVLLVPAVLATDRFVIAREEAYLRRRFGAEYEVYTRRVRRWL